MREPHTTPQPKTDPKAPAYTYSLDQCNGTGPYGQRVLSVTAGGNTINSFTYNANGDTASRNGVGGNLSFTWDFEDRMINITGAVSAGYGYDVQGRRTTKGPSGGPVATTYLYDGLNMIQESTSGSVAAAYVFGPGIDEPLAMYRGGQVYYYDVDGLGSVTAVNNSAGVIQDNSVYDAWGVIRGKNGSLSNPFGYTAREFGDTADWFYRARFYNPTIGKFESEDPLLSSGGYTIHAMPLWPPGTAQFGLGLEDNLLYAYVHNAPTRELDPLGLSSSATEKVETPTCACSTITSLACIQCCNKRFGEDLHEKCPPPSGPALCLIYAMNNFKACVLDCENKYGDYKPFWHKPMR